MLMVLKLERISPQAPDERFREIFNNMASDLERYAALTDKRIQDMEKRAGR
jgi:hypothetical protein